MRGCSNPSPATDGPRAPVRLIRRDAAVAFAPEQFAGEDHRRSNRCLRGRRRHVRAACDGRGRLPGARGAELCQRHPQSNCPRSRKRSILSCPTRSSAYYERFRRSNTRLRRRPICGRALTQVGPPQTAGTGARRTARIAAVAATIAILLGAVWYLPRLRSKPVQPATKIAVAVLPFHALAVSQEARFLGVGIPDAIITRLAGLQQLIPRPTSADLKTRTSPSTPRKPARRWRATTCSLESSRKPTSGFV